jgi:hypothetical protein
MSLSTAAKTYLNAIGAVAIYVAVDQDNPITVGVARDLDKALRHMRRIISPSASIVWIAWGLHYGELAQIAQTPDFIYVSRHDGVKRLLPLDLLVAKIERMAQSRGVILTPHAKAIERAELYAGYLDQAIDAMRRDGTFSALNRAYKFYRQDGIRRNESVTPYWVVMHELRALIIRALVAAPQNKLMPASVITEIRTRFPWFVRKSIAKKRKLRAVPH